MGLSPLNSLPHRRNEEEGEFPPLSPNQVGGESEYLPIEGKKLEKENGRGCI